MKSPSPVAEPGAAQRTVVATAPSAREHQTPPRAHHRVALRVPCRVRLVDAETGEGRTVVGETVNLSAGGVALQVAIDVPLGTWVETLIPRPYGEPLFIRGTVTHVRRTLTASYEVGVATSDEPAGFPQ